MVAPPPPNETTEKVKKLSGPYKGQDARYQSKGDGHENDFQTAVNLKQSGCAAVQTK
jgi:hypothetical protein